ncbi:MAG: DUF4168 domain-containing protein [Balneolia bacterium]|nr:DUF4168 domain-containing protein [Balneolia bacterium]
MTRIIAAATMLIFLMFGMTIQASAQGMPPAMQQEMPDIEVSDDELNTFVEISIEAQEVNMEAQEDMIELVEGAGLSVERFNEILTGMQQGQSQADMGMEDAEMERFDELMNDLEVIQEGIDEKVEEIVESKGMDMDRVQEIQMAVQMNPELQQKFQEIVQEKMGEQPGM